MTTSKDVLEALSSGAGPKKVLVTLGYSGWGAGQLEDEMSRNGWINVDAEPGVIFDTPVEQRYDKALSLLGIDAAHAEPGGGARMSACAPPLAPTPLVVSRFRFRHPARRRRHRQLADADARRRCARVAAEGEARAARRSRALIAEWQPDALVVGVPLPSRRRGARQHRARAAASRASCTARFGLPVHEVDERYTTTEAQRARRADLDAGRGGDHPRAVSRRACR